MNTSSDLSSKSEGETATKARSSSINSPERSSLTLSSPRIPGRDQSGANPMPVNDKRPYVARDKHKQSTDTTNHKADLKIEKGCLMSATNGDEVRLPKPPKAEVGQDAGVRRSECFRNYLHTSANEIQRCQASLQKSLHNKTLNVAYIKYLEKNQEALNKAIDNFEKRKTNVNRQLRDEERVSSRTSKMKFLHRLSKMFIKNREIKSHN
ncbi:hypothetical protein LOTGIDRAFT_155994 [Lottia gigantea]|uniref:Uncharacterized protein n=1 Tax=Lottia gigantea TaxID=225164 RepID=V4BFU6_LOTGI|nr:hypothetical protein LOTGIDRAFT_155994 [Lottia gigantea]ESP04772.1 hypothetical protein LOTGIDRAFT_155994 [Lottia gigantea]